MTKDIADLHREYLKGGLQRKDLPDNPVEQFSRWLDQVREAELTDPTAMFLATVSPQGRPTQRTVLLKGFDEKGFRFFTNLESAKAKDISESPNVGLLFAWLPLERQVRIQGRAEKLSSTEAFQYFTTRPKESQMAAWISAQSRPIPSRAFLEAKFAEIKQRFKSGDISLPAFWGGYRVVPDYFEFWQGGAHRLHDRFAYSLQDSGEWTINRLAP